MVQEAITQAINEVFLSLVKISIFHALWTWLTLTILGVRIVYISTFLTLLFVIFPVIGTHLLPPPPPPHARTHARTRHDTR
jgi:predicted PurR-regulated permease PerM